MRAKVKSKSFFVFNTFDTQTILSPESIGDGVFSFCVRWILAYLVEIQIDITRSETHWIYIEIAVTFNVIRHLNTEEKQNEQRKQFVTICRAVFESEY